MDRQAERGAMARYLSIYLASPTCLIISGARGPLTFERETGNRQKTALTHHHVHALATKCRDPGALWKPVRRWFPCQLDGREPEHGLLQFNSISFFSTLRKRSKAAAEYNLETAS